MAPKPVILLFIDWFSPGYKAGGPVTSCLNFIHLMKEDYAIYVFTSDTDLGETTPYAGVVTDTWIKAADDGCMVYYACKKKLNAKQIRTVTTTLQPDFVYLNHLFSPWFVVYPLWLKWKGIISSRVVVSPRGALYQSALAIKTYKKSPFLKLFRWMSIHKKVRFHATSEREKNAILDFFPGSEVLTADDLPNTRQLALSIRSKTPGQLKCIFIARVHPIKNLMFLLEALRPVQAAVVLTIVGPIEDAAYWQQCQSIMADLPAHIQVQYNGSLPNHALPALLQDNHLFVLPTRGENFGHSIFEAFLAGRPVLISDQTPWLQLREKGMGWDLPLNEVTAFTAALETAAAWNQVTFAACCEQAWQFAGKFIGNPALKQQYLQLFS